MKYCIIFLLIAGQAYAESKRIEVFESKQAYYDVQRGDTLSEICFDISRQSAITKERCERYLFTENAEAFYNNSVDHLIAGKRLWLPGSYRPIVKDNDKGFTTRRFSWGQIKTPK